LSAPVLSWIFSVTETTKRNTDKNCILLGHSNEATKKETGSEKALASLPSPSPSRFKVQSKQFCNQSLRANPFPKVTDLICRLPLPTLFYLTRGFSPRRPEAVMSTTRCANKSIPRIFKDRQKGTGHCKKCSAFPSLAPYLQLN